MKSCRLLNKYKNGNYSVTIYDDGTKIRFTMDDDFDALFPESIDIKITNFCDMNCKMCHEMSSINGLHADLNHPFFDTLVAGTELAIGGGNPLSHPELVSFLQKMKKQGIVSNLTVNQEHFAKNQDFLQTLIADKLIYGLGISVLTENHLDEILTFISKNPNCVIHIIAGIIDWNLLEKLFDKNLKILILGYKKYGRGTSYFSDSIDKKISQLRDNIIDISKHFSVVSFDNLAIMQLDMQLQISKEDFEKYYMGDDGLFTMYIDMVEGKFALSSTTEKRYDILDNIVDMFQIIKSK